MALRPASKTKDVVIEEAVLPNPVNPLTADVEYWNQVPKTLSQYSSIGQMLSKEVSTAFKDTGFSVYMKPQYRFHDVPPDQEYVETLTYSFECSYWSYGKQQIKEFASILIEHFKLNTLTAVLSHKRNRLEFMYQGVRIAIHNYGPEFREKGLYPEDMIIRMLNGYEGELLKVIRHFLGKFNMDVDYKGKVEYILKDGEEEFKRYSISSGSMETVSKMLGVSRQYGNYGYFRNKKEVASWLMNSRYIGKSTFDIDENNTYVGPDDYYGSNLFRELVNIILVEYADHRHTPESLPETIKKHQLKLWGDLSNRTMKSMLSDSLTFKEVKMIRVKYNDGLIKEVTGVTEQSDVEIVKKAFEKHISEKEDFPFFILSSSEETIREKLASYRQSIVA